MKAVVMHGARRLVVEDVPDARLVTPGDAVVRVLAAGVCGSDLHYYRGIMPLAGPMRMGHEFVGIVEEVGAEVRTLRPGDFVVSPMHCSDNTCAACLQGLPSSCANFIGWGLTDRSGRPMDAGQAEAVRVPLADGTLVATPDMPPTTALPDLLALSDVMGTGFHAATRADVGPAQTVVVVGDGAVGLCAVLSARVKGAARIILVSRHEGRRDIAREFGATDFVAERDADGVAAVAELLNGAGADRVLECVGSDESLQQAVEMARPGGRVGSVGRPLFNSVQFATTAYRRNLTLAFGIAAIRTHLPILLDKVLAGEINPGLVFEFETSLDDAPNAYLRMDDRTAIKSALRP